MTAVIVGGDYVKSIGKAITDRGVERVEHWTGRKPGELRKSLPNGTGLVVILCDYVSHNMAKKIHADAEQTGVPVIYCRRSLGQVCRKLDEMGIGAGVCR